MRSTWLPTSHACLALASPPLHCRVRSIVADLNAEKAGKKVYKRAAIGLFALVVVLCGGECCGALASCTGALTAGGAGT